MPTEADTCRTLITPKLQAAGWEQDSHSIAEQRQTTQPNINLGNLTRLRVHVPPLPEQRRIVAELDALQAEGTR